MVQKISLILKLVLSLLFGVLLAFEYFDGVHDLSDWAVFFFFLLMANDAYIHIRSAKGREFEGWVLSPRDASKKLLMNGIFIGLLICSVVLDYVLLLDLQSQDLLYKGILIVWAGIFLGVNIYKLKEAFNIKRLVVTNIALMILIGSFVLI